MKVDLETKTILFHYPLLKDPRLMTDNRGQAVAMAAGLERRLQRAGEIEAYNDALQDQGTLREVSEDKMASWQGPLNYITHHGVVKPGSVTTALRVVSNSSLDNNNSGLSYNNLPLKGPNALIPLLQALVSWGSYQHTVVLDLAKVYNTVYTFVEELHMRRLVWRWDQGEGKWLTYMGKTIDPESSEMIKKGYVNDIIATGYSG